MSQDHIRVFDDTVHTTYIWIKEIMAELHTDSRHDAYRALRLTLQSLRDHMTVEQAAHFASQLPLLLRGVFFDGWNPSHMPSKDRSADAFLERLKAAEFSGVGFTPADIARRVLSILETKISEGEIEAVRESLPKDIRKLWRPLVAG